MRLNTPGFFKLKEDLTLSAVGDRSVSDFYNTVSQNTDKLAFIDKLV